MEKDINNAVEHPSHYTQGRIECIDAIRESMSEAEFRGYLKGCVIKYLWRYDKKDNPFQDIEKAHWYLHYLMDEVAGYNKDMLIKAVDSYFDNNIGGQL